MLKKIIASIVLVLVLLGTTFTAFAASENYMKVDVPGGKKEIRLSKEMYNPLVKMNATSLGLEKELKGITDIFYSEESEILLLCGAKSRLVKISSDYKSAVEIPVVDPETDMELEFEGAEGVYADTEGNIYICDTNNNRVIVTDATGKVLYTLGAPDSDLIPDDFVFQPTEFAKDKHGYIYILSYGCYYGALQFTPEYEFMGFYGANTVKSSALDTLSYLWDKLTSSEEKKNYAVKTLPYSFSDFSFDADGFMVTSTEALAKGAFAANDELGQIKKITHNGANILQKRSLNGETGSSSEVSFIETDIIYGASGQSIVSVITNDDGYIFALEGGHGKIYVYDYECNLMSAFGGGIGKGDQLGLFKTPVSIVLNGEDILVADEGSNSVTVFRTTDYGTAIRRAQVNYLKGDYEKAEDDWKEVLSLNRNCQLAYRGLAMIYYLQEKYDDALEMAEIACDYAVYDLVWNKMISNFVAKYFGWFVLIIAILVIAIFILVRYMRKKGIKLIKNPKVKLLFDAPFHPFNTFDDLKYKKMGSWPIAIIITLLFYIGSVLNVTSSGFLFRNTLLRNYNSLYTVVATIGLLALWSVCNWLVCSMFEGKGTLKDVYVSTSYCMLPWVIFLFLKVVLTNFLPLSTAGLISGIGTVVLIYTFFMLAIAMIKVHDYDFFKFLLTSIVVLFFMVLVVFVILMCGILAEQFISFIGEVYEEIVHR